MTIKQQPVQQMPKPQFNIADMIKNFDKNKKQERFQFKEKPVEMYMSSAEQVYL